ncbi:MAG: cation:proton antiporter [Pirellulaceae bacterium]
MDLLLYLALVPALGVAAQWIAWRTNLPGILLLLLFGVILGRFVQVDEYLADITGGDAKAGPSLLFPLVSLSVAVIMFEGGLSLKLKELREAGSAAFRLCTVGAAITFALAAIAAHMILGFEWRMAFLLGGILTVTGPTVIGPLLRQVRPSRRVASTLKWEGIVIDPIGAVLAVLVFEHLMLNAQESAVGGVLVTLLHIVLVGLVLGVAGGASLGFALRKFWIPDQLQGVAALSVGLLLYAVSNHFAHESGLITVTIIGLWLTNQRSLGIEHIIEFKENLRTLLIGCLFIVLGSRVNLDDILAIGLPGVAFLLVLILMVRPISVFVSLWGSPLNIREQSFIAGLAPRGIVAAAVSSVFALKMESELGHLDIPGSDQLANVTFLVIVSTVAIYGLLATPLAKLLGLADTSTNGVLIAGADTWVRDFAKELTKAGVEVLLVDTNYNKISTARVDGINASCANILNEHVIEELPLSGIGRLLAMTPNDEVNSLAVRECTHLFERSQVYQLTFTRENTHHRRGLTKNLMGRELFGKGNTFSEMREMHGAGARFKTTPLTEEFTYEDFSAKYGNGAVVLASVDEDGNLELDTEDKPLNPKPGHQLIAMVSAVAVPDGHAAKPANPDSANGNSASPAPELDAPDTTA